MTTCRAAPEGRSHGPFEIKDSCFPNGTVVSPQAAEPLVVAGALHGILRSMLPSLPQVAGRLSR